jgi:pilus assembly protein CpaD
MALISTNLVRGLSLAAVLTAGSCTAPSGGTMFDDPMANHPIQVAPSYQSLKINASPSGVDPEDMPRFLAFVGEYESHGNGAIGINVPSGAQANAEIAWIADRINAMGVGRGQILVAKHDVQGTDYRVELNYVSYQAATKPCGDWSEDLALTIQNKSAANFGCAVQQNVAAQVADPRDLLGPHPLDGADAARRAAVVTNYEQGKITEAAKSPDQVSAISDVGR